MTVIPAVLYNRTTNQEDPITPGDHITEEQIALYVESALTPTERTEVTAHLQECARCQEIMVDAARLSGLWMTDATTFPSPTPAPAEMRRPTRTRRHWRALAGINNRWRLAATTAAVALIGAIFVLSSEPLRERGVSQDVLRPLQGALETASSIGSTVIPGGEMGLAGTTSRYRSGFGEPHGVLNQSIAKLEQRRENDPTNRDVSYWLAAAYIATGQTSLARDFAREARTSFPDDADIAILYALVLFHDGDVTGAQRELRHALDVEPDNAVAALNLGIVLLETGQDREAKVLLTRVENQHSDKPIGERARSILASQPNG